MDDCSEQSTLVMKMYKGIGALFSSAMIMITFYLLYADCENVDIALAGLITYWGALNHCEK